MSTATLQSVFERLTAAVQPFLGFHGHFEADLEIDRQMLEGEPGTPFLHWARSHGTTLMFLFPYGHSYLPAKGKEIPYLFGFADREHIVKQVFVMAERFCLPHNQTKSGFIVHHFDGRALRRIDTAKAFDIATNYRRQMFRAFDSEGKNSR